MTVTLDCTECGQPAYIHKGWSLGEPVYCPDHAALRGRDPRFVIPSAIEAALRDTLEDTSALATWCLPELHDMFGFLLPGTVTYPCAFPKNGKTAFISANIAHWVAQGLRPWVMPTEARPKGLLTRIACNRLGLSVDDVMSRRLRARADAGDPQAVRDLSLLVQMFNTMQREIDQDGVDLAIEPAPRLTRRIFNDSCKAAAAGGHGIVVVDHVDHIGGDPATGESGYAASEAVQYDALEFAETYNLAVVLMSQLNTSRVHNDPLYRYRRPITDWLWMKGVKDQIVTTMFGIYRPMRTDLDDKLLAAIKSGDTESWRVAMPNTMGVVNMLSRYAGERPDEAVFLHYEHGRISSKPAPDQWDMDAHRHGIPTGDSLYGGRL